MLNDLNVAYRTATMILTPNATQTLHSALFKIFLVKLGDLSIALYFICPSDKQAEILPAKPKYINIALNRSNLIES